MVSALSRNLQTKAGEFEWIKVVGGLLEGLKHVLGDVKSSRVVNATCF